MQDWDTYQRARKRAEGKLTFYIHLVIYLIVSAYLVTHNLNLHPQYPWVQWPVVGWGIGVVIHALLVFVFHGKTFGAKTRCEIVVAN